MTTRLPPLPRWLALLLCLGLLNAWPAAAICVKTSALNASDWNTALMPFGRVNLASSYLQPPGTLLASIVVPSTNYRYQGANSETILWKCGKAEVESGAVYFLVATNGDSRFYGEHIINEPGLPDGVYATQVEHVGLRQHMAGVTLRRRWKKLDLTPENYEENCEGVQNIVCIRLKHIPPLHAELYRVNQQQPGQGVNWGGCLPAIKPSHTPKTLTCIQPSGYIQLVGNQLPHDQEGEDGRSHYKFWFGHNGFGYGMRGVASFSATPTCVARTATPHVLFPAVSVAEMEAGTPVSARFSVQLECSDDATSGTGYNQTAIGLQVSNGALLAAQRLGLVNSGGGGIAGSGGVKYLLSDDYGAAGIATGVGIRLYRSDDPGSAHNFIGHGTVGDYHPRGADGGWYPFNEGTRMSGTSAPEHTNWHLDFTATLERLPGQPVTPGKVHATATVLVKVQ